MKRNFKKLFIISFGFFFSFCLLGKVKADSTYFRFNLDNYYNLMSNSGVIDKLVDIDNLASDTDSVHYMLFYLPRESSVCIHFYNSTIDFSNYTSASTTSTYNNMFKFAFESTGYISHYTLKLSGAIYDSRCYSIESFVSSSASDIISYQSQSSHDFNYYSGNTNNSVQYARVSYNSNDIINGSYDYSGTGLPYILYNSYSKSFYQSNGLFRGDMHNRGRFFSQLSPNYIQIHYTIDSVEYTRNIVNGDSTPTSSQQLDWTASLPSLFELYYDDFHSDPEIIDNYLISGNTSLVLDNNYNDFVSNNIVNKLSELVSLDSSSNRNGFIIIFDKNNIKISFYDRSRISNNFVFNYSLGYKDHYIYSSFSNSSFYGESFVYSFSEFFDNFSDIKSNFISCLSYNYSNNLSDSSFGFNERYSTAINSINSRSLKSSEYSYLFYSSSIPLKLSYSYSSYHTSYLSISYTDHSGICPITYYSYSDVLPSFYSLYSYIDDNNNVVLDDYFESDFVDYNFISSDISINNFDLSSFISSAWTGAKTFINAGYMVVIMATSLFNFLPSSVGAILLCAFTLGVFIILIKLISSLH